MNKLAYFQKLTYFIHIRAVRNFIYSKICMLTLCFMQPFQQQSRFLCLQKGISFMSWCCSLLIFNKLLQIGCLMSILNSSSFSFHQFDHRCARRESQSDILCTSFLSQSACRLARVGHPHDTSASAVAYFGSGRRQAKKRCQSTKIQLNARRPDAKRTVTYQHLD